MRWMAMLHGMAKVRLCAYARRRIVEILQKPENDLTEEDYQHMKNVRSYIMRHVKQARSRMFSDVV